MEQNFMIDEIKNEFDLMSNEQKTKDTQLLEFQNKGKNISEESGKYVKHIKELTDKYNESKRKNTEMKKKMQLFEKEKSNMNTQFENMIKDKKKLELENNKKELKINKLNEDLDKIKVNMRNEKITPKTMGGNEEERGNQKLINENKKLEKQRNELLVAFKKQLKMIDLLKRQKTHLEAAQMYLFIFNTHFQPLNYYYYYCYKIYILRLKFTEEQFIQALELGGKIG